MEYVIFETGSKKNGVSQTNCYTKAAKAYISFVKSIFLFNLIFRNYRIYHQGKSTKMLKNFQLQILWYWDPVCQNWDIRYLCYDHTKSTKVMGISLFQYETIIVRNLRTSIYSTHWKPWNWDMGLDLSRHPNADANVYTISNNRSCKHKLVILAVPDY